jgi:3-phenylpropionate/trans-cinnamate dioxygenase ferredoxin reductase subunit
MTFEPMSDPSSFSILHYWNEKLIAVESGNASGDHVAARKLLERKISPDPSACDPTRPLASLLGRLLHT